MKKQFLIPAFLTKKQSTWWPKNKIQETSPQRTEKVAVLLQQREDKISVKAAVPSKPRDEKTISAGASSDANVTLNFHCSAKSCRMLVLVPGVK